MNDRGLTVERGRKGLAQYLHTIASPRPVPTGAPQIDGVSWIGIRESQGSTNEVILVGAESEVLIALGRLSHSDADAVLNRSGLGARIRRHLRGEDSSQQLTLTIQFQNGRFVVLE